MCVCVLLLGLDGDRVDIVGEAFGVDKELDRDVFAVG